MDFQGETCTEVESAKKKGNCRLLLVGVFGQVDVPENV